MSQGLISQIISGVVSGSDDGHPLPGVNIKIKGTDQGTITDLDGKYSIEVGSYEDVLIFSYVGYSKQEITVGSQTKIDVVLNVEAERLEEVVVNGYGTLKKSSITGSVAGVSYSSRSKRKMRGRKSKRGKSSGFVPMTSSTSSHTKGAGSSYSAKTSKTDVEKYSSKKEQNPLSGQLTAGELNDFGKWELWKDLTEVQLKVCRNVWPIEPQERFTVQLNNHKGQAIIDKNVFLYKNKVVVWKSKTDNTGKAELWNNVFGKDNEESTLYIYIEQNGERKNIGPAKLFRQGINYVKVDEKRNQPSEVDIAFVVDATGSMNDEIQYLKNELYDIMSRVKDSLKNSNVNLASVFYRDKGDDYVTRFSGLSRNLEKTVSFVKNNNAGGGGDNPEAVDEALHVAIEKLNWHKSALSRIIFLILDAPPHNNSDIKKKLKRQIKMAAAKGIRIVPVTCSGIDKNTEYLMRSIALLTNGTYTFLTDHSGIGNSHIEPSTDEYSVETLNDLLVRIIYQYTFIHNLNGDNNISRIDSLIFRKKEINGKDSTVKICQWENNSICNDINGWEFTGEINKAEINFYSNEEANELEIRDLSGKIIEKIDLENTAVVDLSNYPAGKYYIVCQKEKVKQKFTLIQ